MFLFLSVFYRNRFYNFIQLFAELQNTKFQN